MSLYKSQCKSTSPHGVIMSVLLLISSYQYPCHSQYPHVPVPLLAFQSHFPQCLLDLVLLVGTPFACFACVGISRAVPSTIIHLSISHWRLPYVIIKNHDWWENCLKPILPINIVVMIFHWWKRIRSFCVFADRNLQLKLAESLLRLKLRDLLTSKRANRQTVKKWKSEGGLLFLSRCNWVKLWIRKEVSLPLGKIRLDERLSRNSLHQWWLICIKTLKKLMLVREKGSNILIQYDTSLLHQT